MPKKTRAVQQEVVPTVVAVSDDQSWTENTEQRLARVNDTREKYRTKFGMLSTLNASDIVNVLVNDTTKDDNVICLAMREMENKITKVPLGASGKDKIVPQPADAEDLLEYEEDEFDLLDAPAPDYHKLDPEAKRIGEALDNDAQFTYLLAEQAKVEIARQRNPVAMYHAIQRIAKDTKLDITSMPVPGTYATIGDAPARSKTPKLSNQPEYYNNDPAKMEAKGSWYRDELVATRYGRDCLNRQIVLKAVIKNDAGDLPLELRDLFSYYVNDVAKENIPALQRREKARFNAMLSVIRMAGGIAHQMFAINSMQATEAGINMVVDKNGNDHVIASSVPIYIADTVKHIRFPYTARSFLRLNVDKAKELMASNPRLNGVDALRSVSRKGTTKTEAPKQTGYPVTSSSDFCNLMLAGENYYIVEAHKVQLSKMFKRSPSEWRTVAEAIVDFHGSLTELITENDLVDKIAAAKRKSREAA